jgi:hypothetical protein
MAIGLKFIEGDFVITPSGNIEIVQQAEKCGRDLGKMVVTNKEFADNETTYLRYNPTYGTELNNRGLFSGLSRQSIRDMVIYLLNEAFEIYKTLQENRQNLDVGEIITGITMEVYYDLEDLRNLIIEIKYSTAYSNQEITLGQYVQPIV